MNTGDNGRGVGGALAIFGAACLAWGWLLTGAGVGMQEMDMGGGSMMLMRPEWTLGYAALVLAMWVVMMVAMMLPSAAAAILGAASPLAFAAAYLAIWTGFSLAATFAQFALDRSELLSGAMALRGDFAAGLVILAVGLYQFTPLKHSCLRRCASPSRGEGTATQSLLEGLRYGANCLGCCWALMTLLFVAGLMNLLWVAAVALWLTAEKLLPWGGRIARIAGAGLAAWGSTLLASSLA
jgi:predicted metal-binding membrane protein